MRKTATCAICIVSRPDMGLKSRWTGFQDWQGSCYLWAWVNFLSLWIFNFLIYKIRITLPAWFTSQCLWVIMNVKVLCKVTFYTNIKNGDSVVFDEQDSPQTVVRKRRQLGIPLFHLIDSSNTTEAPILCCIFPWWSRKTHICPIRMEEEPSELPPISALELGQAASPELTDLRRGRLTSFCVSFAAVPLKCPTKWC